MICHLTHEEDPVITLCANLQPSLSPPNPITTLGKVCNATILGVTVQGKTWTRYITSPAAATVAVQGLGGFTVGPTQPVTICVQLGPSTTAACTSEPSAFSGGAYLYLVDPTCCPLVKLTNVTATAAAVETPPAVKKSPPPAVKKAPPSTLKKSPPAVKKAPPPAAKKTPPPLLTKKPPPKRSPSPVVRSPPSPTQAGAQEVPTPAPPSPTMSPPPLPSLSPSPPPPPHPAPLMSPPPPSPMPPPPNPPVPPSTPSPPPVITNLRIVVTPGPGWGPSCAGLQGSLYMVRDRLLGPRSSWIHFCWDRLSLDDWQNG